jgi:uncharacterized protein YcbX
MGILVGHVAEIVRYPVKSMAGERLAAAELDWQGIEGDRQYAFYHVGDGTRFPWLTGRDLGDLVRHIPRFRDQMAPRTAPIDVETPGGATLALAGPELRESLSAALGTPVALMQLGRGCYDAMPVSLVTTATLAALDGSHGTALDRRRFRSNIVIEAEARETEWRGRRLAFGDGDDAAELLLADGIPRCAMITIDPDSAQRDPKVLRTVARDYANRIGIYSLPARPGVIREGSSVYLSVRLYNEQRRT